MLAIGSAIRKLRLNSFMTGDRYHIETSPFICSVDQWTGFYMITASVLKELNTSWGLNWQIQYNSCFKLVVCQQQHFGKLLKTLANQEMVTYNHSQDIWEGLWFSVRYALREGFNFYFLLIFANAGEIFISVGGLCARQ